MLVPCVTVTSFLLEPGGGLSRPLGSPGTRGGCGFSLPSTLQQAGQALPLLFLSKQLRALAGRAVTFNGAPAPKGLFTLVAYHNPA